MATAAAAAMAYKTNPGSSSVCPRDKIHGRKEGYSRNRSEYVED
jgi:hypothetical protein